MTTSAEPVGVPADVADLWTFYTKAKSQESDALNLYGGKLILRTQQYRDEGNSHIHKELAQHWINFLSLEVKNVQKVTLPLLNISRFIDLLTLPGVIESLTSKQQNHHILACALLQAVCEEAGGAAESYWFTIPDLLERWSTKEIPLQLAHTPVTVANFLYGPGVWDIYRNDVEDDEVLPAHLFSLGVPLNGPMLKHSATPSLTASIVPEDLA